MIISTAGWLQRLQDEDLGAARCKRATLRYLNVTFRGRRQIAPEPE